MTNTDIYTITDKVIASFKPTRLYIKRHTITGLKYFGKTVRTNNDFTKYLGSGTVWIRHLKKHGKEHVETIWVSEVYTVERIHDLVRDAITLSEKNDIVNSKEWANLILENGIVGTPPGTKMSPEQNAANRTRNLGRKWTPEQLAMGRKTRATNKAAGLHSTKPHGNKGKKKTSEQLAKQSVAQTGKTKRTNSNKGRKWPAEQLTAFRLALAARRANGTSNWNLGKKWTPARRAATKGP